jgi:hypothetical protein
VDIPIGAAAIIAGLALWFFLVTVRGSGRQLPVWSSGTYPWSKWVTGVWVALGAVGGLALTNGLWACAGVAAVYLLVSLGVVAFYNSGLGPAER